MDSPTAALSRSPAHGLLAVWCAVHVVVGKELKYPEGIKPGDQVSGSFGEYFRYKHVLVKPPDDDDRREALAMAEDVKCKACEALLAGLLKKAESFSEDHIMDQLDGDLENPAPAGDDPQENRVNQYRKGCNKHFKDELLLRGWRVQRCPAVTVTDADSPEVAEPARNWCFEQNTARVVTERDVDTYSIHHEAAFYACENTVARYGHELAAFLAEKLEDGGNLETIVPAACREAAKCAGGDRKRRRERQRRRRRRSSAASEL